MEADIDSPLDQDFEESGAPVEEELSKEELLAAYMASLGYRPKTPRGKDTLEYFRTYSDPLGRVGRAVVVIKKDEMGLEPKAPDYVTVTVQFSIQATDAEIRQKAPTFCKQDLLRILAHYDTQSDRNETEVVECKACGMRTAEFILKGEDKLCLDCSKRKGTQ